jgi:hypothetical protein
MDVSRFLMVLVLEVPHSGKNKSSNGCRCHIFIQSLAYDQGTPATTVQRHLKQVEPCWLMCRERPTAEL